MMHDETALASATADLVVANHVLFDRGVVDGFGHVSVRHPSRPDQFLLSRNRAPVLVTADDILVLDLDGEVVGGGAERTYLERFIHSEIYLHRPDVGAVVHSHVASVLPFTIVGGLELCPVCHMSGFIKRGTPVFEIRCHAGEASDLLIRDRALGGHLARSMGDHAVVLMRGHGMTVVAPNLRQAVFRAVYTETNARIQAASLGLGPVTYLTEAEADAADAANTGQIDRAWSLWAMSAARCVAALRST